jgi:hypothetical protein
VTLTVGTVAKEVALNVWAWYSQVRIRGLFNEGYYGTDMIENFTVGILATLKKEVAMVLETVNLATCVCSSNLVYSCRSR